MVERLFGMDAKDVREEVNTGVVDGEILVVEGRDVRAYCTMLVLDDQ